MKLMLKNVHDGEPTIPAWYDDARTLQTIVRPVAGQHFIAYQSDSGLGGALAEEFHIKAFNFAVDSGWRLPVDYPDGYLALMNERYPHRLYVFGPNQAELITVNEENKGEVKANGASS